VFTSHEYVSEQPNKAIKGAAETATPYRRWLAKGEIMGEINMSIPEYLALFSDQGPIKVQVKLKDFDGFISDMFMAPGEVDRLISKETGKFITKMTFDEWPFEVYKYEIDPINNLLTIKAKKINVT
jgi:hypothetical protein